MTYTYKNVGEFPLNAGFSSFLKDLAFKYNVNLTTDITISGWVIKRERVRFRVTSKNKKALAAFVNDMIDAIEENYDI